MHVINIKLIKILKVGEQRYYPDISTNMFYTSILTFLYCHIIFQVQSNLY